MLYKVSNPDRFVDEMAESPAHAYIFRRYCELKHDKNETPVVLGDDPVNPVVMLAYHDGSLLVMGDQSRFNDVAGQLFEKDVDPGAGCSIGTVDERHGDGTPGMFCNSTPLAFWQALVDAGFTTNVEDEVVAYTWYLEGGPRFSELIQHPCRLGEGIELHEFVRRGISYDPEGYYTKLCLENGPSFVCEVDGEKVCWSATHLNGTMAMIYTPEEHRRKGYAKSLSAFQMDYMLEQYGIACCHIISTNTASMKLVENFGFVRAGLPLVWRSVHWPEAG